jgi:hypothetical protein
VRAFTLSALSMSVFPRPNILSSVFPHPLPATRCAGTRPVGRGEGGRLITPGPLQTPQAQPSPITFTPALLMLSSQHSLEPLTPTATHIVSTRPSSQPSRQPPPTSWVPGPMRRERGCAGGWWRFEWDVPAVRMRRRLAVSGEPGELGEDGELGELGELLRDWRKGILQIHPQV